MVIRVAKVAESRHASSDWGVRECEDASTLEWQSCCLVISAAHASAHLLGTYSVSDELDGHSAAKQQHDHSITREKV